MRIYLLALCLLLAGCSRTPASTPPGGSPTPAALALSASPTAAAPAAATPLPPTAPAPAANCRAPAALTPADMEGPYYLGDTPERDELLEPGMRGVPLALSGFVLHADCSPVAGARLDFWQADAAGEYDLNGYRLRGHLFTAADGSYHLETVLPAVYGGRPRHIHVKIDAPGFALTTQLYFPGDSPSPAQTVALTESGAQAAAAYTFIIP